MSSHLTRRGKADLANVSILTFLLLALMLLSAIILSVNQLNASTTYYIRVPSYIAPFICCLCVPIILIAYCAHIIHRAFRVVFTSTVILISVCAMSIIEYTDLLIPSGATLFDVDYSEYDHAIITPIVSIITSILLIILALIITQYKIRGDVSSPSHSFASLILFLGLLTVSLSIRTIIFESGSWQYSLVALLCAGILPALLLLMYIRKVNSRTMRIMTSLCAALVLALTCVTALFSDRITDINHITDGFSNAHTGQYLNCFIAIFSLMFCTIAYFLASKENSKLLR